MAESSPFVQSKDFWDIKLTSSNTKLTLWETINLLIFKWGAPACLERFISNKTNSNFLWFLLIYHSIWAVLSCAIYVTTIAIRIGQIAAVNFPIVLFYCFFSALEKKILSAQFLWKRVFFSITNPLLWF